MPKYIPDVDEHYEQLLDQIHYMNWAIAWGVLAFIAGTSAFILSLFADSLLSCWGLLVLSFIALLIGRWFAQKSYELSKDKQ